MKLFICAHEGNQLCWIAFKEKGATNGKHVPCNSFAIAMAQQFLGTGYPLLALSINAI
jgi:hypothetical protein